MANPVRQYTVTLTRVGETDVRVQYDGIDELFPVERLFDRTPNEVQIIANLRFAMRLTAQAPTSQILIDFLNVTRGGVKTRERTIYLSSIRETATPDLFTVTYGYRTDDASYGFGVTLEDLQQSPTDVAIVVDNIAAFLRISGFNDLTPEAIEAVASWPFRGF